MLNKKSHLNVNYWYWPNKEKKEEDWQTLVLSLAGRNYFYWTWVCLFFTEIRFFWRKQLATQQKDKDNLDLFLFGIKWFEWSEKKNLWNQTNDRKTNACTWACILILPVEGFWLTIKRHRQVSVVGDKRDKVWLDKRRFLMKMKLKWSC